MAKINYYAAVTIDKGGKYYATVVPCIKFESALAVNDIDGVISSSICKTQREAQSLADDWNSAYADNGTLFF